MGRFKRFVIRLFHTVEKFFFWVKTKTNSRQFIIFSSFLIGITGGLAAVLLKQFVHFTHWIASYDYKLPFKLNAYLYLIFPILGIVLTVFIIRRIFNNKLGRGTSNIIRSIVKKSAFLPKDQMYSHILTSGITVGFGGSAGLESPIVTTGAAIGSNYAKTYHLVFKERLLLLACGAAAGIGAAFNAPIAGVLFALEVLLSSTSISAFTPLIISASVGALISKILLREDVLMSFLVTESFNYYNVPYYLIFGAACGLMAVYYSRIFARIEQALSYFPRNSYRRAFTGGLILSVMIYLMPPLFGEGYESIKSLANNKPHELLNVSLFSNQLSNEFFVMLFVFVIMILKAAATSLTINSGGNGGSFAPSLFVGAYLGYLFSRILTFLGFEQISTNNFTLVGMAGVLSGIFHAPLTGIFLIAEISGGYALMIPLMLVSATSYAVVKSIDPMSMDERKLAKKGGIDRTSTDTTILSSIKTKKLVDEDYPVLREDDTLRKLISLIPSTSKTTFAIVDTDDKYLGIISLENIREVLFDAEKYDSILLNELVYKPKYVIEVTDSVQDIIKKFELQELELLPVLEDQKVIGFIKKSKLLEHYRSMLISTTSFD